jgi:hypothetical protein
MSEPNPAPPDRLCVLFHEALNWIAFSNFAGRSIGPFSVSQTYDHDELAADENSRVEFAQELLLSYAARERIKLYADIWECDEHENRKFSVRVDPTFISRASLRQDVSPTLYWLQDKEDGERYVNITVDYDDLTEAFWGKNDEAEQRADAVRAEFAATTARLMIRYQESEENLRTLELQLTNKQVINSPLRRLPRQGRPPKHKWSEFTKEAVRYCLQAGPLRDRTQLLNHMKDWCAETWFNAVEDSEIRAYADPVFQEFQEYWTSADPGSAEENSGTEDF